MDNQKELSILIIAGDCLLSVNVLRCLAPIPDLKVHVLSSVPDSKTRFSRPCASFHLDHSAGDDRKYLQTIAEVAKRVKAHVLFPVGKPGIFFAIKNASSLSQIAHLPPLPVLDSFKISNDKWELAKLMREKRIPAPQTILLSRDANFKQKLEHDLSRPDKTASEFTWHTHPGV